jgi:hypothetical protein
MARSLEDIGGNLIDGFTTGPTLLFPVIRRQVNRFRAPVSIATAGPATYSVEQLKAGIINRDPNGSSRTDTTPTAALIIGTFNLNFNDDTIQVLLRNTSDAAETITLAGGTGVTIGGAAVIAAGESRTLTFVRTSSTAVLCTIGAVGSFSGTFTGNLSVTGDITASGSLNGATLAVSGASALTSLSVSGASALVDVTTTGLEKTAPSATPTNLTTNTDLTYTAAQLAVGIITRDPNGGARTDTTDTAANLITGLALSANYQERYCTIVNTADAAETITLAGGVGVTLKGTITIAQNQATRLAFFRTGAAAVCVREV